MTGRSVGQIVDRDFLDLRGKLLELAAAMDRIERAGGQPDARIALLLQGMGIAADGQSDRAERIQLLFSRTYSPDWQSEMRVNDARQEAGNVLH